MTYRSHFSASVKTNLISGSTSRLVHIQMSVRQNVMIFFFLSACIKLSVPCINIFNQYDQQVIHLRASEPNMTLGEREREVKMVETTDKKSTTVRHTGYKR